MNKKRMIILTSVILLVVVISLGIVKLYQTYALGNYVDTISSSTYDIVISENTSVKVPENSYSNVFYMVNNTSPGAVTYGVGYETDANINVKVFSTSKDPASGIVQENGKKYVKLRIENSSSTTKEVNFTTILGYSGDSDLIVPDGITLVTEVWSTKGNFVTYIKDLYEDASKETTTNNNITYNYATSESLMNDRLGDSDTDIDGGNVRYYGASPNNYVYFNCNSYPNTTCERWRIIGVFDGKIKLIRNEVIGTYSWDNKDTTTGTESDYGSNDWSKARLMKLLNPSNYYTIDSNDNGYGQSLYYNGESGTCFAGIYNATTSCNFTSTGLKTSTTRNMISTETYSLLGWNSDEIYSNEIYNYERTTGSVYNTSRPTSWNGKIALAYPSDYGYAADFNQCTQTLYNYDDSTCTSNNWLKNVITNGGSDYGWLLTPYSSTSSNAWVVDSSDGVDNYRAYNAFRVAPVLYLNSKIELVDGTGTYDDPYQISDSLVLDNEVISTYTISYSYNVAGESSGISSQTKIQNVALTLSDVTPTRAGYQFVGWNTEADGSGTSYQAGASFYENNNVTLYAQWNKIINISYDANGGSGAPSAQTKLSGESLTLSSTIPTRTGYTFYKWNTSSSGNGTYYSAGGTYSADTDVTLYAVWTVNQYTLTLTKGTGVSTIYYKVNGASSWSATSNSSISLDVNYNSTYYYYGVSSSGYTMAGCTADSPCTGTMGTSSATITPSASVNSYTLKLIKGTGVSTIYYKVNGASNWSSTSSSSINLSVQYGTTYYYYGTASTGYTMSNCTSSKPCSYTKYAYTESKTLSTSVNSYTLTLTKGTGVSTIYYKVNGASSWSSTSSNSTNLSVQYGTTYYYYGTASTGYTMSNCTEDSPCSYTKYAYLENKTLSASANSYTLTLTKGTGVSTIYYKVNGASSWSSTSSNSTNLSVQYGTTYYYYGTASTGYQMTTSCIASSPCSYTKYAYAENKSLSARINVVHIQYSPNGGTLDNDNYSIDSSTGLIMKAGSTSLHTINYGSSLDNYGLLDVYADANLKVIKSGNMADMKAEWICLSGCTTSGKTFNEIDSYSASDFCDASSADCYVTLGVNWTSSYSTIKDYRCSSKNTIDYYRITYCNSTYCKYIKKNGVKEYNYIERSNLTTCYIIEFDANGGTFNNTTGRGNSDVYYRRDLSLNTQYYFSNLGIPTLTRSGCTFNGWKIPSVGDGTYTQWIKLEEDYGYYTYAEASWTC